jgi:enoyl-CoA hydratase/carnithine racemase
MPLNLDIREDWAELELSRPPRNLLAPDMLIALLSALDKLEEKGAPLLLLKASGRHFSTGYPVDAIPEEIFHADNEIRFSAPFERVMKRLSEYPAPVVAAVQGDAYGGAMELLCCTDLRLGVHDIRFGMPAVRLGIIYSLTGLRRMAWCLGNSLLVEMLLTGEPVSARRMLRSGFLHRLVAPKKLDLAARMMLDNLAQGAPLARNGTRRMLRRMAEAEPLPAALVAELGQERHESWLSEDFREAQAAFVEKRRPNFKGR